MQTSVNEEYTCKENNAPARRKCFSIPSRRQTKSSVCRPRYTIELGPITQHNVKMLETINTSVFPVLYNDKFYKDVLNAGELAQLGE